MKPYLIFLAAFLMASLSSCGGKDEVIPENEAEARLLKNASPADSLLFYVGQIRAARFWDDTAADTTTRTLKQRESFLKGVESGLHIAKEDQEAYNAGVRLGLKLAQVAYAVESDYGIPVNKDMLYRSLRAGILDTIPIDPIHMQSAYYDILWRLNQNIDRENNPITLRSLKGVSEDYGLTHIREGLWMRTVKPGDGGDLKRGDRVTLEINYTKANGESLGMPSPEIVVVGEPDMPPLFTAALLRLKPGASAIIATSANSIFGTHCDMVGLRPINVVVIHLTVLKVETGYQHFTSPEPSEPVENLKDSLILI